MPVHNGRYHVLLGGQGMTSLPASLFLKNEVLYLRVEFDNGDGDGLRHLEPDKLITATPRALVAEVAKVAEKVTEGGITAIMLSPTLITDLNRSASITEITREMLGQDVLSDLNRTITLSDLSPEVIADLNDSITPGSITLDLLSSQVRNDLNRTITYSMLDSELQSLVGSNNSTTASNDLNITDEDLVFIDRLSNQNFSVNYAFHFHSTDIPHLLQIIVKND